MQVIETIHAPSAIGIYSQAIRAGDTVYLSGQIPLDPQSMEVISPDIEKQIAQVFRNLAAVAEAAGGTLASLVKLTIYLTDLSHFQLLNQIMAQFFKAPYPARAVVEVSALPRAVLIEMDAVMVLA